MSSYFYLAKCWNVPTVQPVYGRPCSFPVTDLSFNWLAFFRTDLSLRAPRGVTARFFVFLCHSLCSKLITGSSGIQSPQYWEPGFCHQIYHACPIWVLNSGLPASEADVLRMGRIWNFTRIEYRLEYPQHFGYKSNIKSNTNIQWLWIRLESWTVLRCLAEMQSHPVAMSPSPSRQHCAGATAHMHWSFCLLSDLTMKTSFNSRLTYLMYSLCTHTRLQNKIIYIPVKNKITKTNLHETQRDLWGLRWLCICEE